LMPVDGTLFLGVGSIINGLKPNRTTFHSVTLAGTVKNDGSCKGTQYSDPYRIWDDIVVQAIARVSIKYLRPSSDKRWENHTKIRNYLCT